MGCILAFNSLVAIKRKIDAGLIKLKNPLVVPMFDSEESGAYGAASVYAGSRAAIGACDEAEMNRKPTHGPHKEKETRSQLIAAANARLNHQDKGNRPTTEAEVNAAIINRAGFIDLFLSMGMTLEQIEELQIEMIEAHIEQGDSLNDAREHDQGVPSLRFCDTVSSPVRTPIHFESPEPGLEIAASEDLQIVTINIAGQRAHSGGEAMQGRRDTIVGAARVWQIMSQLRNQHTDATLELINIEAPSDKAYSQTAVAGETIITVVASNTIIEDLKQQIRTNAGSLGITFSQRAMVNNATAVNHDIMHAAAATILAVSDEFTAIDSGQSRGFTHMRGTVGIIRINRDGSAELNLDIRNASRAASAASNGQLLRQIRRRITEIASRSVTNQDLEGTVIATIPNACTFVRRVHSSRPVAMDEYLISVAQQIARQLVPGIQISRDPSYPGHDCANMAQHGIYDNRMNKPIPVSASLWLLPSENGSHNPAEAIANPDAAVTQQVLTATLEQLLTTTREPQPPPQNT